MSARALVLDFGGVISKTLFETHALTEQALGLPAGSLTWRGPFDPANDEPWRRMQVGKISERDYWLLRTRETGRLLGLRWDKMAQFVQRSRGASRITQVLRPQALALIERATRAGLKLAILSNELDLFYGENFRDELPFLNDVELIVDATYSGILKPDPRAYQRVTDGLSVAARDCVFIDDQEKNIRGGIKAGMQTVLLDVCEPDAGFNHAAQLLGLSTNETSHARC